MQERLAAAVLALDPKQRDVVLLRHFDGAPVADIARRLGLARATVHEHLERGHAELRRALAPFDDDRRMTRGLALLVAAGDPPRAAVVAATAAAGSAVPALPLLVVAMNLTKSLAAVALVATLSFVAWRAVGPPDVAPPTLGETEPVKMDASATVESERESSLQVAGAGAPRTPLATAAAPESESGTATLRVRVVDEDNVGVHLARVVVDVDGEERNVSTPRAVVETDRDGYWSSTVPAGKALVVSVNSEDASPARQDLSPIASASTLEATIRVRTRPDLDLVFSVVDAVTHEPISGARGTIEAMNGGISGRDVLVLRPETASDFVTVADGTARVRVKSWQNVSSRVHADGYAPRERSAPCRVGPRRDTAHRLHRA